MEFVGEFFETVGGSDVGGPFITVAFLIYPTNSLLFDSQI